MKTATYKSLRDGIIRRMGLDASLAPLTSQSAALAEYIQSALDGMWDFYPWPDVTLTEQRTPVNHLLVVSGSALQNPIGEVLEIFDADPAATVPNAVPFDLLSDDSIFLNPDWHIQNAPVWVRFRLPAPVFSSVDYNSATTYSAGDVVYYDLTGDCYLCIRGPAGNIRDASLWRRQLIPAYLAEPAKLHALAEAQQEDGQYDKANFLFARSKALLEDRQDDFWMRRNNAHHFTAKFNY